MMGILEDIPIVFQIMKIVVYLLGTINNNIP
ncbi:hypothetical protein Cal6303_1522 [Calothrix sp. PCC 6303]|nr:hypothetical protein Cal6303_1522 [Calothrix sp. PCC 6303]